MPDTAVTSRFTELVCADDDWVRAEFAEIVAANFPAEPVPPAREPRARRSEVPRTERKTYARPSFVPRSCERRQRSPPLFGTW
ncbi:MAG TPA: hypothetical protein VGL47_10720 [Amycolatopsis sp.]|uniref:hypothetical protein n=1 Tax=Amycolatopsis sp. TaxID=37632 RepID=UPI002F3E4216